MLLVDNDRRAQRTELGMRKIKESIDVTSKQLCFFV